MKVNTTLFVVLHFKADTARKQRGVGSLGSLPYQGSSEIIGGMNV